MISSSDPNHSRKNAPRFYRAIHKIYLILAILLSLMIVTRLLWTHSQFWQMHFSVKSASIELLLLIFLWALHFWPSKRWAMILQMELAGFVILSGLFLTECVLLHRFNGTALIRLMKTYDGSTSVYSKEAIYARLLKFDGLSMAIFIPDTNAECQIRDVQWNHSVDHRGMRNPSPIQTADILLIGDSYTYGFGLDLSETLAAQLEKATGLKVAVLANANSGMFPKWLQLRACIDELKPKAVVCLVCHNDPLDDWIDAGEAWNERSATWSNAMESPQPTVLPKPNPDQLKYMIQLPLFRSMISPSASQIAGLMRILLRGQKMDPRFDPSPPYWPILEAQTHAMPSDDHPGWPITLGSLQRISELCQSRQVKMATLPIMPPKLGPNVNMANFFEMKSKELNLPMIPSRELTNHPNYFLPTDGHFSPEGNKAVAIWIANWYQSLSIPK